MAFNYDLWRHLPTAGYESLMAQYVFNWIHNDNYDASEAQSILTRSKNISEDEHCRKK